jgi:rhamnogalacturonan endolyase
MSISKQALLGAAMGLVMGVAAPAMAQQSRMQVENLDRGAIAVKGEKGMLVSWRALVTDPARLGFNVYRDGRKLNAAPITTKSNFLDEGGTPASKYEVRDMRGAVAPVRNIDGYLNIPLDKPADGKTADGRTYTYSPNDASVGDLDGDGDYEIIVKWDPSASRDNSGGGYTGNVLIDAYTLEGKRLWRVDLGRNIRAGAHYTQFQVADYDGDGKAEMIVKTADGTVDGQGKVVGDASANWVSSAREVPATDRTGSRALPGGGYMAQLEGRIMSGPEYLSVFDGATGRVVDTIPYPSPRGPNGDNATAEEMTARWGDAYGNRSERYLAGTAWLDGVHPSAVMARGYYGRSTIAAVDYRGGKLVKRWYFDSEAPGVPQGFSGMGNHQFSVADIDGDGKQEIIYGSMALDDNGKPLWSTGYGHGDAMHVGDLDPTNPGLEKFGVHENMRMSQNHGSAMVSLRDGKILWDTPANSDTGRGVAGDIDPRFPGAEAWNSSTPYLYNAKGQVISDRKPNSANFLVWWDGDLSRELLDGNRISKWDGNTGQSPVIFTMEGATTNNGSKSNPAISGDILGDWREEVIERSTDNTSLRIYSTSIPTDYRITTLAQDPQYRAALAWQNTAYNQPPHPSFNPGPAQTGPAKTPVVVRRR